MHPIFVMPHQKKGRHTDLGCMRALAGMGGADVGRGEDG